MAQRPESRAVKTTRVKTARLPADDVPPNPPAADPVSTPRRQRKPLSREGQAGAAAEPTSAPAVEVRAAAARPSRASRTAAGTSPVGSASPIESAGTAGTPTAAKRAARQSAAKPSRKTAASPSKPARRSKRPPPYLAAELGQPIDHEGEPIGAGSPMARSDRELQDYTLQLWQQMQSRRGVNQHVQAMERSGLTIDDLWTTGVTGKVTTSSTPDEVRRYRQNLLFRANLLEAILSETVAELRRLDTVEPTPAPATGSG